MVYNVKVWLFEDKINQSFSNNKINDTIVVDYILMTETQNF